MKRRSCHVAPECSSGSCHTGPGPTGSRTPSRHGVTPVPSAPSPWGGPLFSTGSAVDRGRSSCVSSRLGHCVVVSGRPGSGGRWLLVLSSGWFRAGPRRLISLQLPARARRRPREHSAFSPWQSANSFIYTYVFLNILQAGNDSETFCSFSIVPSALPPVLICLCPP